MAKDRDGNEVNVGTRVRILHLSGRWFDELPEDERADVAGMIGETFVVDEIDDYGNPWVTKTWKEGEDRIRSHGVALAPDEMIVVEREL